jgi:hypothetical protein
MGLADDFDKIGGPLQKPLRKPQPPPKAAADATAVKGRTLDNVLPTMDEHGVSDIVNHLGLADSRQPASSWNPSDPWSADNPSVAKAIRALTSKK